MAPTLKDSGYFLDLQIYHFKPISSFQESHFFFFFEKKNHIFKPNFEVNTMVSQLMQTSFSHTNSKQQKLHLRHLANLGVSQNIMPCSEIFNSALESTLAKHNNHVYVQNTRVTLSANIRAVFPFTFIRFQPEAFTHFSLILTGNDSPGYKKA